MSDSDAREQVAQEFPNICGPCSSEIRPINKITSPSDTRSEISSEYRGLPGTETSFLFGSQGGNCPLGWPNSVSNHTFDKGEYLFSKDDQFISTSTENPPYGSYSYSLERIDPIPDVKDVSPVFQVVPCGGILFGVIPLPSSYVQVSLNVSLIAFTPY